MIVQSSFQVLSLTSVYIIVWHIVVHGGLEPSGVVSSAIFLKPCHACPVHIREVRITLWPQTARRHVGGEPSVPIMLFYDLNDINPWISVRFLSILSIYYLSRRHPEMSPTFSNNNSMLWIKCPDDIHIPFPHQMTRRRAETMRMWPQISYFCALWGNTARKYHCSTTGNWLSI